jgi:hypothetical protein
MAKTGTPISNRIVAKPHGFLLWLTNVKQQPK